MDLGSSECWGYRLQYFRIYASVDKFREEEVLDFRIDNGGCDAS